jgi:hypothetical protein
MQRPTAEFYQKNQEHLNYKFSSRVEEWLKYFGIDYSTKVLHIIEWPPTSHLPWRSDMVSTRARFLWIGAKIRFSLGGTVGECPSFSPKSLKSTHKKVEIVKRKWMKTLLMQVSELNPESIKEE